LRFNYIIPACILLGAIAGSCDLLKTRDPQPPTQGETENPPATLPEILVTNLVTSFTNKNVNDYQKLFSDIGSVGGQYVFVPTQKAKGNYGAIFSRWTTESEANYFRKAAANVSVGFVVTFSHDLYISYQPDSELYTADYTVFIAPKTYVGHARFSLLPNKSAGTWVIDRWEDLQSANDSTLSWSDLKGQFSQ